MGLQTRREEGTAWSPSLLEELLSNPKVVSLLTSRCSSVEPESQVVVESCLQRFLVLRTLGNGGHRGLGSAPGILAHQGGD